VDKMVLIRTIVLAFALLNQGLVLAGYSPLPFEDTQVEEFLTGLFTVVASLWAWWKNNSITKSAKEADEYLKTLKEIERDGHK
jgi:SPP1 family holin